MNNLKDVDKVDELESVFFKIIISHYDFNR